MKTHQVVFCAVLILFGSGCASVMNSDKPDSGRPHLPIEGVYEVVGEGYRGKAIIRQVGDTYLVQWKLQGISYSGIGIRDNDRLSASWFGINGEKGIVVYRIGAGPRLTGQYALFPGRGGIRNEILRFKAPLQSVSDVNAVL